MKITIRIYRREFGTKYWVVDLSKFSVEFSGSEAKLHNVQGMTMKVRAFNPLESGLQWVCTGPFESYIIQAQEPPKSADTEYYV